MRRKVLLLLERDEYTTLARLADEEQREVYQQAQLLLRNALRLNAVGRAEPPKEADDAA